MNISPEIVGGLFCGGLNSAEISTVLGVPESAVYSALARWREAEYVRKSIDAKRNMLPEPAVSSERESSLEGIRQGNVSVSQI